MKKFNNFSSGEISYLLVLLLNEFVLFNLFIVNLSITLKFFFILVFMTMCANEFRACYVKLLFSSLFLSEKL